MVRRVSAAGVQRAAPLFAALGDPTRLGLVARLSSDGPGSIASLCQHVDVSRQAVTKHLHVLADAGLVHDYRDGRLHMWELKPRRLADAHEFLDRIGAQWDEALERLRALVEES